MDKFYSVATALCVCIMVAPFAVGFINLIFL